jgi:hypothetical protein
MIRHSALESLAGREKMGREGLTGGLAGGHMTQRVAQLWRGDPAADTGRGGGGRCRAALVVVSCTRKNRGGGVQARGPLWFAVGPAAWAGPNETVVSSIYSNIFKMI